MHIRNLRNEVREKARLKINGYIDKLSVLPFFTLRVVARTFKNSYLTVTEP